MKIGIFGGCFNPPHKMHLNICLQLLASNQVDKIIIVPTGDRYQKADLISAKHRYNMAKLMFAGVEDVQVSSFEVGQNAVYTYQTLKHFKQKYKNDEIALICGEDNFMELQGWKNYREIVSEYEIIVAKRGKSTRFEEQADSLSSLGLNLQVANIGKSGLSSTKIRKMLKNNQKSILKTGFLNENVLQYIQQNQLYTNGRYEDYGEFAIRK